MTKAELLQILKHVDDNAEIILSRDAEGSEYRKLYSVDTNLKFLEKKFGRNKVYLKELTDEDIKNGFTEEDTTTDPNAVDAAVLY